MPFDKKAMTDHSSILLFLAALLVIFGRWARGQKFDWKIAPAVFVVVILVAILKEFSPELGDGFAALAFVAALMTYGADVLKNFQGNQANGGAGGHASIR